MMRWRRLCAAISALLLVRHRARGDIFGMTGRWVDLMGGLSTVYIVVSEIVMYVQLWRRRRRKARGALVWA